MAEVSDILINNDGSFVMAGGDFVIGESTKQHQRHLLLAEKGSLITDELAGVGIAGELLNDADGGDLKRSIQIEFERDGMVISELAITEDGELEVAANYL